MNMGLLNLFSSRVLRTVNSQSGCVLVTKWLFVLLGGDPYKHGALIVVFQ